MFLRIAILAALALLATTGCQHKPTTQTNVVTQDIKRDSRINELLTEAEIAIQKKRLTTPVEDNAYLRYLQVLAEDPGNNEAEQGIARIVETYLGWAVEAINRDQFSRASSMLNKANSLDEANPAIKTLRHRLATARHTEKVDYKISNQELQNRATSLSTKLAEIAAKLESEGAKARINAQTDADARWIYQQLNNATDSRVRATIQTGTPPSVQLSFP